MLQVTPQMRVFVATEPADFRKGIDGMAQLCRVALGLDPFSGALFVFTNRRRTALKVLVYDGRSFWLCHQRLSSGKFRWWPSHGDLGRVRFEPHQLAVLISAGNPEYADAAPLWRPVDEKRPAA